MVYFEKLYNSVDDSKHRSQFNARLASVLSDKPSQPNITVQDIIDACNKQKSDKACGPDQIPMEASIHGSCRLHVHLCLLFNLFIQHGYLPAVFMQSVITPLVKNKNGDLFSLNNYGAIAVSDVISKLYEGIIAQYLQVESDLDVFQFEFKRGHSTALFTDVFKQALITTPHVEATYLYALLTLIRRSTMSVIVSCSLNYLKIM